MIILITVIDLMAPRNKKIIKLPIISAFEGFKYFFFLKKKGHQRAMNFPYNLDFFFFSLVFTLRVEKKKK